MKSISLSAFLFLFNGISSIIITFFFSFQRKALGKSLYEKVIAHSKLVEPDYFGLQFTDTHNVKVGCPDSCFQLIDILFLQQWLDPTKSIKKQCKSKMTNDKLIDRVLSFLVGPPYTFRFRVKFYTSDPQNLHDELTRYEREKAREKFT